MKTSRSIVLLGVSSRYLFHTWRATSCGEDFEESGVAEIVVLLVFNWGCGGEDTEDVLGVELCLGVAGAAGFFAIVRVEGRRVRQSMAGLMMQIMKTTVALS